MLLYDFECTKCGNVFEELIKKNQKVLCQCGGKAKKLIPAPRLDWRKMGLDPSFPTASDRWAKAHVENGKKDYGDSTYGQNLKMY